MNLATSFALSLILCATLILGWLFFHYAQTFARTASDSPRSQTGGLALIAASIGLGVAVLGWLAVCLAEVGLFRLSILAFSWGVGVVGLIGLTVRRGGWAALGSLPRWSGNWWQGWFLLWLVAASWLFLRPHQSLQGGADAGVYVSLAANIAHTGQILIHDDLLAEMAPTLRPAFLRPLPEANYAPSYLFPGFYASGESGDVTPQFYPLHPVWQALVYALGGKPVQGTLNALHLTGLWALLGTVAIYLTVRQTTSRWAAFLALVGVSLNAIQIWFARYSVTESLTQYLLWLGLWGFGIWWEGMLAGESRPQWGLLAGLMFGSSQLVRIDMFFILALPAAAFLWLLLRPRHAPGSHSPAPLASALWFFVPVLLLSLHTLIHAWWQSRPYFVDTFSYIIRYAQRNPMPVLLGMGGMMLLLAIGYGARSRLTVAPRWVTRLKGAAAVFILLWGIYGWFLRPVLSGAEQYNDWYSEAAMPILDALNFWRLGWYLSPLGVWLGIVGMAWLVWRLDRRTLPWFTVGLFFSLLYLWRIQASQHQIYTMRRYMPAVMPFFIIAAANLLAHFSAQQIPLISWWRSNTRQRLWTLGTLGLTLLWLAGFAWLARGFISQVDHAGLVMKLDNFSQTLSPGAILIFNDAAAVGQADFLGTPLHFIFGQDLLIWREPDLLDAGQFRQQLIFWQGQGRAIYWIEIPGGHAWPLPNTPLPPGTSYQIESQLLEGTYDRRPTTILTNHWAGEMILIPEQK